MKTNEDAFENDDDIDEMEEDSSIDDEAAELDKWVRLLAAAVR